MTDTAVAPTLPIPSSEDYAAAARRRRLVSCAWCAVLSIVVALLSTVSTTAPLLLPAALILALATPFLLWHYPKFAAYAVIGAVCLVETLPLDWPDSFTDKIPFFWNLNTVLQRYGHTESHAAPLNVFEIFLLEAAAIALFRAVYTRTLKPQLGRLFWPIAAYMVFVGGGWCYGMMTGGDFKISLQEVRSQFYFLVAYLMAVNFASNPRDVGRALWLMALPIGVKGVLYTVRRLHYITFSGMALPDQGIGSHEEAFFFDSFIILLMALSLCDVDKVLRRVMWALLPFVVMGDLACNRRAATAAFVVVVPMLLMAGYQAFPKRRRHILAAGLALTVIMSIYYPLFKDRYGMVAEPARAIRSQFDPDPRDKSSNDYRIAEEADLYATIRSAPLGYGYGKPMLHAVPIADISALYPWWDIMTHNQILWVWMRVGTIGFIAFWLMIASIVICAGRTLRDVDASKESKAVALSGLLIVSALLIFGLLDLQLSNFRDMLFAGTWAGMMAALPRGKTTEVAG